MKTFAVLNGDVVINVIVADSLQDAELATNSVCVEYTPENPAGIGWTYDGEKLNPPVVEVPPTE